MTLRSRDAYGYERRWLLGWVCVNRTASNLTFALGFFALAAGVVLARANPATSYESSIYTGTPTTVWLCFAVALGLSVVAAVAARGRSQTLGIVLSGDDGYVDRESSRAQKLSILGMGDALTHLGWTGISSTGCCLPTN